MSKEIYERLIGDDTFMMFGYGRVSSRQQNEDRQVEALISFGIPPDNIYIDKESGKSLDRVNYQRLRNDVLREGDTLVVKELDRLSRNKSDIRAELEYYKQRSIRVIILDIPTTCMTIEEGNKWVLDMVSTILIEVLGSIAEAERLKIRKRQAEGISAAQSKGVRFGRKPVRKPKNWGTVYSSWKNGNISAVEAMHRTRLKKTTFYRLAKETAENERS